MPPRPGYRRKDYDTEPSKARIGPQFVEPHSEWQLLVEKTRATKRLSIRTLAELSKVPAGTFFNWIRAKSGCPPYTTYKPAVNDRLAKILGLPAESLWQAYKNSLDSEPVPAPTFQKNPSLGIPVNLEQSPAAYRAGTNKLAQFQNMLAATGKQSFSIQEITTLISILNSPDA